jgi:PAS domain S-box-containing protein
MLSAPAELARHALDAAPDAMIIVDASGSIRFANRQVCALFGYAYDEIVGHGIEELMRSVFAAGRTGHRKRDHKRGNVRYRTLRI